VGLLKAGLKSSAGPPARSCGDHPFQGLTQAFLWMIHGDSVLEELPLKIAPFTEVALAVVFLQALPLW
jgi:hypothetical protein